MQLAAATLGIELHYEFFPEKRSLAMLNKHAIDARMESEMWVDNPEDYLWSEAIVSLDDVFVFHKDSQAKFETDDSLIGAEIITHLGYSYPTLQNFFSKGISSRKDYSSELAMLNSLFRPIDGIKRAAVMNKQVALWLTKANPKFQDRLLFSKRLVGEAPLQFQFFKNDALAKTVQQLNIELKKMKVDDTLDKIAQRLLQ